MEKFIYKAVERGGRIQNGEFTAVNRAAAFKKLEKLKLQPISLSSVGEIKGEASPEKKSDIGSVRLSKSEVIFFTEELSDLLEAGLQLEAALGIMGRRKEENGVKVAAQKIRQLLRDGVAFSVALKSVSNDFDELYCKLVAAGEQSGALDQILKSKLEHLMLIDDLKKKVTSALVYPAFIMGAGMLLIFIFMTYLVPQLTTLFVQSGKKVPLITRLMIDTSSFLANYWWLILGIISLFGFAFYKYVKGGTGRVWWAKAQLRIPLVGKILFNTFYSEFSQTLSTLTKNGVPLLSAIKLVQGTTANVFLQKIVSGASKSLSEGVSFSRALSRGGVFPNEFLDMIAVGEETGQLPSALEKISKRYDKELNQNIGRLTALIQPTVVIVMALIVGVVAFSMMSGIFQAVSSIRP